MTYKFPEGTNRELIIFTDLDGTLLDHDNYAWTAASPALEQLKNQRIPLILTTSKTLAEVSLLAHELHNYYPCIVENGAGIAWPLKSELDYEFEALGVERDQLLEVLTPLHQEFEFRSCIEMSIQEFVDLTGLEYSEAERAMQRNFSEPFIWSDDQKKLDVFTMRVESRGLNLLKGGRFFHLIGKVDKGIAMDRVTQVWAENGRAGTTLALGDSQNDVAMLQRADRAVVVRSAHQKPPEFIPNGQRIVTEKIGPEGWNDAVLSLLEEKEII